jgi:hypothetical protein
MYYYTLNGQQQGPVAEEELNRLVATGVITAETLVWREGMAEWKPYAQAMQSLAGGMIPCSVCKTIVPMDETVRVGNQVVCASCKPKFVQGMREGVEGTDTRGLYAIAKSQRRLLSWFGVLVLCNVGQVAIPLLAANTTGSGAWVAVVAFVLLGGVLIAWLFTIVSAYQLAKSLGYTAILYAIGMVFPCIGLIVLLVLSSRATQALKRAGVKVGLIGPSKAALEALRQSA